jgi:fatty acid cis/trans isomerase CTI
VHGDGGPPPAFDGREVTEVPMRLHSSWLFAVALGLCACVRPRPEARAFPEIVTQAPLSRAQASASWASAQRVLEGRCVVCHGCYDAPCQLKLDSYAGIARGATDQTVYGASRLKAAEPTRLEIDAHDVAAWRQRGFHPVLPEGAGGDPQASLILRMLALKQAHPLPQGKDFRKDFTFDLDRKQTCADAGHFDAYAREHPLWGMPYGLPPLDAREQTALGAWIADGAPYPEPPALSAELGRSVEAWESFLNQRPLKSRLMARYVFEHLFLASLYFAGVDEAQFFRLVRSRTPPGSLVDEIATRRPFDDPRSAHLYYRFVRRVGPALSKTHMAYALDARRLELYRALFLAPDYDVERLPSYEPQVGANPFRAFAAIPVRSRYRFMLTEAEFTLMGFIKGPVCRGQVALNVIQDRFWVTFLDPDAPWMADEDAFLAAEQLDLDMPAEGGSSSLSLLWQGYGKAHERYMKKRGALLAEGTARRGVDLATIWDGDGDNASAALTVFRHFDSATVVQGLVGGPPKTAWVIDYPLLERIHYLLVAGFDVFGDVGHQYATRVYMDFLRMEGESNFLMLLPVERRPALVASWYRGVTGAVKERAEAELLGSSGAPRIAYRTATPELELFPMLRARVERVLAHRYELPPGERALARLGGVKGLPASRLPEASFLTVRDGDARSHFSILRESAHTNVAHLFGEAERRVAEEDALSVVPGFLSAYPNALFEVERRELDAFVDAVGQLDGDAGYRALRLRFGVLRGSPEFWRHSDRINQANRARGPIDAGVFDYNHLDPM